MTKNEELVKNVGQGKATTEAVKQHESQHGTYTVSDGGKTKTSHPAKDTHQPIGFKGS